MLTHLDLLEAQRYVVDASTKLNKALDTLSGDAEVGDVRDEIGLATSHLSIATAYLNAEIAERK